jgi:hypothetical protein
MKKLFSLLIVACSVHATPIAHTKAILGPLGRVPILTAVTLHSHHHYDFSSDNENPTLFNFKITLCPETQPLNCVIREDHLWMYKGQRYSRDINLERTVMFRAIGSKSIVATSEVTGGAYSYSVSQGYVDVHY